MLWKTIWTARMPGRVLLPAAIAVVMLVFSFILLLAINLLQAWTRKRAGKA